MQRHLNLLLATLGLLFTTLLAAPAALASTACTIPTALATSQEQTAWEIFTAINCNNNGALTWETWTEQSCIINGTCDDKAALLNSKGRRKPNHHLHGSHLGSRIAGRVALLKAGTPGGCSPMTQTNSGVPSLVPFVPKNITSSATFCEEVFVNPTELNFIKAPAAGASLTTLIGQQSYITGNNNNPIQFPSAAIEVKADWLPASSLSTPFTCSGTGKPKGVHVETIDGKCYALVAMHISSKLSPNWLWATFEPQNSITNPNRCNPNLYNNCQDNWGSVPAVSTGAVTRPTAQLLKLMLDAGLLTEFLNYRLVGTQTAFNQPVGLGLGNSFVEFNAEVPVHQASCITCHSYAVFASNATNPSENPNFGAFPGGNTTGNPTPLPSGNTWLAQDFSWLLGIMPTGSSTTKAN